MAKKKTDTTTPEKTETPAAPKAAKPKAAPKAKKAEAAAPAAAAPVSAAPKADAPAKPATKAAKPKPAPKQQKQEQKPAPLISSPLIDTNRAAENAAKMISALGSGTAAAPAAPTPAGEKAEPKKESSAFKQLKQSLNRPHGSSTNPLLNTPGGNNKFKPSFLGGKQVGHNQTNVSGAARFLPRRTSGG